MPAFNSKEIIDGSPSLIPAIADAIKEDFAGDGYKVSMDELSCGGYDISITKGGIFKSVLGMRTALKVSLVPYKDKIRFEAGVGIWGQQAIPTIISMLVFWPVLITQIWGMVQQSKLDDRALILAKGIVKGSSGRCNEEHDSQGVKYCTSCGKENIMSAKFCCNCGKPI